MRFRTAPAPRCDSVILFPMAEQRQRTVAAHQSLRVECYSGYRGAETPARFHLGARAVEVREVLDRWLAPEYRYFKLRGADGGIYILRHDDPGDRWELILYDCGHHAPTRLSST